MNKLYIVSTLALASIVCVNAQEVGVTRVVGQAAINQGEQGVGIQRGVVTASARPIMARGGMIATSSAKMIKNPQIMQALPGFPVTGDPAIDAQVKTLSLEMNAKIKAINDEYMKKIQALIGNKATIRPYLMMTASGTIVGREPEVGGPVLNVVKGEMIRGEVRMNERDGTMSSGTVRMLAPMFMQTQENNASGVGAQFGKLFRGIFGGSN